MTSTLSYPLSDKQTIFDHVWQHFVVAGNPLAVEGRNCVYDTPSGGCVIGCLLPEDFRKQIGKATFGITHVWSPDGIHSENALPFRDRFHELFGEAMRPFLSALQSAHDSAALDGLKIEELLRALAQRHGLRVTGLTRRVGSSESVRVSGERAKGCAGTPARVGRRSPRSRAVCA